MRQEKFVKKYALLIAVFCFPIKAMAQDVYISADLGPNFAASPHDSTGDTHVHTSTGVTGVAAAGVYLPYGFRAEVEGDIRSNSVRGIDTLRSNGAFSPISGVGGSLKQYSAMANVLYDIPVGSSAFSIKPYIGGGIGYSRLNLHGVHGDGNATIDLAQNDTYTGAVDVRYGSAGAVSYQGIVGVAVPIRQVAHLSVIAEYRYFGVHHADVPVTRTAANGTMVNGATPVRYNTDDFSTKNNAALVGLRYVFGK